MGIIGTAVGALFSSSTSSIKTWLYGIGVVAIFVTISSFYLTMKSTQREIMKQSLVVQEQQHKLEEQSEAIESLERLHIINDKKLKEMMVRDAIARESNRIVQEGIANNERKLYDLQNVFNKNGRDLGELAQAKSGLVERVVNKGTEKRFRCLEILTGSPLTKEEEKIVKKNPDHNFCS